MRSYFERSVAFLLPADLAKKNQRSKHRGATILAVGSPGRHNNGGRWTKGTKVTKGVTFNVSKLITGVEFLYYKLPEFKILSEEQQNELKAHRNANGN